KPGEAGSAVLRPRYPPLTPSQFADEDEGKLTGFDCVYLCDLPSVNLFEARRLEAFVRRGGGGGVCLGGQVQPGGDNRVLYRGGNGLMPAPLVGVQNATDNYAYQLAIEDGADRTAPLKAFRAASDRNALLNVRFRRFFQLGEPAGALKPRKLLSFQPIAIPG